jgi:hypothetical protein
MAHRAEDFTLMSEDLVTREVQTLTALALSDTYGFHALRLVTLFSKDKVISALRVNFILLLLGMSPPRRGG